MLKLLLFLLCVSSGASLEAAPNNQVEFVVVIPSYNNERVCIQNIESVANQSYPNWSLIYIDDCSTDKTGELVENFIKERGIQDKCTVIHNKNRKGAMANYYAGILQCAPEKVVATLDGDDWLAHDGVLELLSKIYADKTIWVTHGNYTTEPFTDSSYCTAYPESVQKNVEFRSQSWMGCQLRTFYAKLFHFIKKEHLEYKGAFVPATSDLAFMFPILEMASDGHIHFVSDVLYVVNTANPLSDIRVNQQLQSDLDTHIRSLPTYKPIKKLFFR